MPTGAGRPISLWPSIPIIYSSTASSAPEARVPTSVLPLTPSLSLRLRVSWLRFGISCPSPVRCGKRLPSWLRQPEMTIAVRLPSITIGNTRPSGHALLHMHQRGITH